MTQAESEYRVTRQPTWRLLMMALMAGLIVLIWAKAEAGCPCSVPDAAEILRLEDRREPVQELFPYLESDDANTRRRAVLAIGRVAGPVPAGEGAGPAHGVLTQVLRNDVDPWVRSAAAFSLGLLGSDHAGTVVAALLVGGEERSVQVRAAAVEALGKCSPENHPAAMEAALHDPDKSVVRTALLAVWRGAPGRHLPRILELSSESDPEIRWRAAYALMRSLAAPASGRTSLPQPQALTAAQRDEVLDRMLPLANDHQIAVQLPALRGLGRGGEKDERWFSRAQARLMATVDRPDARSRVEAVRALAGLYEGKDTAPDLSAFLGDEHPHVRAAAIRAAAQVNDPPALLALLEASLDASLPWERATALEVTAQAFLDDGQYAQALHLIDRGLADPHWMVRYAAANAVAGALASMSDASAGAETAHDDGSRTTFASELRERVRRCLSDDSKVSKAVVAAWIGHLADQVPSLGEVVATAKGLLFDDDEIIRAMALGGLSEVRADSSLPAPTLADEGALLDVAGRFRRDPSNDVRATLVEFLGLLMTGTRRPESAELLLELATGDEDRLIRAAAIEQLREHTSVGDPWAVELTGLEAGPQATGRSLRDYDRILEETWRVREAILFTAAGELRFALYGAEAPLTVYSFIRLAEDGYFDHGAWHRVVPDFVIQDGCPRSDGWGGPGYSIRCEYNEHHYQSGSLGMALAGKDTGGSQFFFTLSDQPHLDGRYTVFGRLILGYDVMEKVVQGEAIRGIDIIYDDMLER